MDAYKVYGKVRAEVRDVKDPDKEGRIITRIVGEEEMGDLPWAIPNFPPNQFSLPKVGDHVWVEFERGDIESPIWTGWIPTEADIKALNANYDVKTTAISASNLSLKGSSSVKVGGGAISLSGSSVTANGEDLTVDKI
jgi:Type VI secretion system/phage-baseplate injector OB domain